jgi:peptidoglycan/LPS O-acetylase OafA/YrhL
MPVPAELQALAPHQGWYWLYAVNLFQVITHGELSYFNTLHLWSLSVEEQFYLVWPIVVLSFSPRGLLRFCLAAVLLALGFRSLAAGWNSWAAYALMPARMDALAIGGAIAVLTRDAAGSNLLRRWWRPVAALGLAAVLSIAFLERGYHEDATPVLTLGYLLNALCFGALVVGILAHPGGLGFGPFRWRWLQWTGKVSYGAYVYHLPLLLVVAPVKDYFRSLPPVLGSQLPAQVAWLLLMSAVTLATAGASYRWFERPFLRLKDRFAGAPASGPVTEGQSLAADSPAS